MGGTFGPILLLGSLFGLLIFGMPIAYALGLSAVITAVFAGVPLEAVWLKVSDGVDNFALLAIPFFVFAGALMAEGGMAWRLVAFANIFVGWVRGGLAMVNVLASMFFGGISGSSVADVSSIGSIMIPMMKKQGYDDDFSVNVTITSATQGIVIPPSHNAIIYSFAAGGTVSIAQLFLAGIIPGILIGIALMVLAFIVSSKRGYPKGRVVSGREALKITWEALAGLFTVFIIVGGVIGGFFTTDGVGGGRCRLGVLRDDVYLSRPVVAAVAGAPPQHGQNRRHGDDRHRLCFGVRLLDDTHANAGKGHGIHAGAIGEQVRSVDDGQRDAAGARHVHGYGAPDSHLHANPAASHEGRGRRPLCILASSCC